MQRLLLDQTAVADLAPLQGLTGLQNLSFDHTAVADLAPLQGLTGLRVLSLGKTAVADLTPLQGLTGLQRLWLNQTAVADLTPLQGLTGLLRLWLNQTAVADLRPIRDLALPTEQLSVYLWFTNTPATWQDPELLRLSGIEDNEQRTRETLAYLRTLPPWPEAYVPATARKGRPRQAVSEPQSANPDTRLAVPKGLKRLSLSDARHILEESRPLIRDRCQFVVAAIDDALANHLTRIPNEPEALQAHEVILNALTLSKAAIIGIYDAVPDDFTDQPIDDIAAGKLRAAFDRLLAQLKQAASYVDQKDHTPTYGGLLKLGSVTAIGSVLALVPGVTLVAAIPFLYACLYGPEAAKALGALLPKPGG